MSLVVEIVEGWTGPLDWQLQTCSTSFSIAGTDHVAAYIYDRNEVVVTTSTGVITEVTAACGHVRFAPCTSCQFKAANSPYTMRFRVQDSAGTVVFFPNADAIYLKVRSV